MPLPIRFTILGVIFVTIALAGLALGSVNVPLGDVMTVITGGTNIDPVSLTIIHDVREPRTITALLVGAALGMSGLEMQTLFRNPLADPYVLGISSGASLGVALVVLSTSASAGAASFASGLGLGPDLLVMVAAALGAAVVLLIVMLAGRFIHSSTILLLLGVMIGYFVSSGATVLLSRASPELITQYTRWQFGSYHGVTWENLRVIVPVMVVMILASLLLAKPLNALLLGERYAQTMGTNLKGGTHPAGGEHRYSRRYCDRVLRTDQLSGHRDPPPDTWRTGDDRSPSPADRMHPHGRFARFAGRHPGTATR